jgi:hypothetical protein
MPDASHQQNAKPFQIMSGCKAIKDLNVAIIARCTSKMEDPERFLETIILKTHDYIY